MWELIVISSERRLKDVTLAYTSIDDQIVDFLKKTLTGRQLSDVLSNWEYKYIMR